MNRTLVSTVLDAPVGQVWNTIRPFDSLAAWHPYVAACAIEGRLPSDKVGCVRRLELHDGGVVRETLLALSDVDHRIVYDIIESPMPVENYIATLTLHEVTEGAKTYATWSVEFDTPADQRQMMIAKLQDIFRSGFSKLNQVCRNRADTK